MRKMLSRSFFATMASVLIVCPRAPGQTEKAAPTQLDRPIQTTLLIEGRTTPMRGEITAWTFGAFWALRRDGQTPVRIGWEQLSPGKVYETMRRLLERDDATGYLRLGIEMLRLDEPKMAQRAFGVVERVEPDLRPKTTRAIDLYKRGEDPAQALLDSPTPARVDSKNGDSAVGSPAPAGGMRARAQSRVGLMRNDFEQIETDHFIVLAQQGDIDAEQFAAILERIHAEFVKVFGVGVESTFFEDKCVCYLVTHQDDFRTLASQLRSGQGQSSIENERSFFVRRDEGKGVELGFHHSSESAEMWEFLMYRDCARAIIDHYRSDRSIPHWVEEGLIRHVGLLLHPDGNSVKVQVRIARKYCKYNNVGVFIRRSVDKFDSMSADSIVLSHFLVRSLIVQKPTEFASWLRQIKDGDDWEFAMEESLGVDVNSLGLWFEAQLGVKQPK